MRAIPQRMRAARLYGWGDVRVEEVPVPAIADDELLIRVEACGICGSDALDWYVERKAGDGPVVLGHEPVGIVARAGAAVTGFAPGDRVFVHHHAPCRRCEECRRNLWSNCAVWKRNALEPGGFAEYTRVAAQCVAADTLRLPEAMPDDAAIFIEPLATCVRALRRHAPPAAEDVVFVVGLGAMGQLLISLARVYGARRVMGSDFLADRRDRALRRGAEQVFDPGPADVPASVRSRTDGRGADLVIVCPGDPSAISAGIDIAAPGARVVCFTPLPPDRPLTVDQGRLYFREITLAQSYSCGPDETREALDLLAAGRIEVESLLTHRAGLDGVAEALDRAHRPGSGMKTVVHPGRR